MAPASSPLAVPLFRAVWIATFGSNLGAMILIVGASWIMASSGAPPQMVAWVQSAASLPVVLLSVTAGALADTVERRTMMIQAQVVRVAVSATLAVLVCLGMVTPWLLLVFTFLVGCSVAVNAPAWQASVGDMVPRSLLPSAVALNAMGMNLARSAGPAVGGAIVAVAGGASAFAINALTALPLIAVLKRWRDPRPERPLPRETLGNAIASGLRYSARSPQVRAVIARTLLFALPASALQALMPLVARDLLRGGPLTYGLLLGAFGAGAIAAAFATRRLRAVLAPDMMVRASAALVIAGLAGCGWSRSAFVTLPAAMIGGMGWVVAFSTFNVSVQLASPRWVVARTLALYQTGTYVGLTAGSAIAGIIAARLGVASTLLAASVAGAVILLLSPLHPLHSHGDDDPEPANTGELPSPALALGARSGPIVIAIEHRVLARDVATFLALMTNQRHRRLRDGARHWTLLRDVSDLNVWIERYDVANWAEYLRHVGRRTSADEALLTALHQMSSGGAKPPVRRLLALGSPAEWQRWVQPSPVEPGPGARTLDAPL